MAKTIKQHYKMKNLFISIEQRTLSICPGVRDVIRIFRVKGDRAFIGINDVYFGVAGKIITIQKFLNE